MSVKTKENKKIRQAKKRILQDKLKIHKEFIDQLLMLPFKNKLIIAWQILTKRKIGVKK